MLTVKECLETVKVQKYIVFVDHDDVIGSITREIVDDDVRLIFSHQRLIAYLDSCVCEIIPFNNGCSTCNLILDFGLPFDC